MTAELYEFRPMTAADLPLVLHWLTQPHVVQWWGDTHEQFELVSGDLEVEAMDQYIVATGGRPFAYIQCYDPEVWPDNGLGEHPKGTRGVDQFIGEADMLGRGHGSAFIRAFIEELFARGVPRIVIDPSPDNPRAIRAYEKAGFVPQHEIVTPDGAALLMIRNP